MSSSPLVSIPGLVFSGDLEAEQTRLRAQADAVNTAVQACGADKLGADTVVAWTDFYTALVKITSKTPHTIPWPWYWDSDTDVIAGANIADTILAYERELIAWQDRLAPKCTMPPRFDLHRDTTGQPPSQIPTAIKWIGIAAAAIAGAYVVSKVVPLIAPFVPERKAKTERATEKKNPLPGRAGPKRSSALIHKARSVRIFMADGRTIKPRGDMLHDPSGRAYPKSALIIGPFRKGGHSVPDNKFEGAPRYYLGRGYRGRYGSVRLPPKNLRQWQFVGYVSKGDPEDGEIQYTRTGSRAPGGFYHAFNKRGLGSMFNGRGRVRLYRYGSFYRLQMPRGAIVDDRGFVWP